MLAWAGHRSTVQAQVSLETCSGEILGLVTVAQDQGEDLQRSGHILKNKSAEQINILFIYSCMGARVCSNYALAPVSRVAVSARWC